MFRKLRIGLLLLNMSLTTVVFIIAFAMVYAVTWKQVDTGITADLMKSMEKYRPGDFEDFRSPPPGKPGELPLPDAAPPDRVISFSIGLDDSGNMDNISSFYDGDEAFYNAALSQALDQDSERGKVSAGENQWAYIRDDRSESPVFHFVDISQRQDVLDSLIINFLIVFILSLIVIYIVSSYVTHRSILPVKDAFEKQTRFITDASHELKTPLAVILSNLDALAPGLDQSDKETMQSVDYIRGEVKRLSNLTNDLLYLSRMDSSAPSSGSGEITDLSELCEKQILGMEAAIFESGKILESSIDPGIIVRGSESELTQLLIILLDNARKYSDEGGRIQVNLRKQGNHSELSVSNSGPGLSEEERNSVFDRFYKADKSRNREGNSYGLGLAIAQAIVQKAEGKIICRSSSEGPTVFTCRFKI
jgi:signal transduction histidine kinase